MSPSSLGHRGLRAIRPLGPGEALGAPPLLPLSQGQGLCLRQWEFRLTLSSHALALGEGEASPVEQWQTGLSISGMKTGLDINRSLSVGSGGWQAWGPFLAQPQIACVGSEVLSLCGAQSPPAPHPQPTWAGQSPDFPAPSTSPVPSLPLRWSLRRVVLPSTPLPPTLTGGKTGLTGCSDFPCPGPARSVTLSVCFRTCGGGGGGSGWRDGAGHPQTWLGTGSPDSRPRSDLTAAQPLPKPTHPRRCPAPGRGPCVHPRPGAGDSRPRSRPGRVGSEPPVLALPTWACAPICLAPSCSL